MSSEFSYGGGKLPKDADLQREHQRDVREAAEEEHRATEAARSRAKRPWWRFWERRSG